MSILTGPFFAGHLAVALFGQRYAAYLQARYHCAAENIANVDTVGDVNGLNHPYRRKIVKWDPQSMTWSASEDWRPFKREFDPEHPLANADGFVLYPNIDIYKEFEEAAAAVREMQWIDRAGYRD